MIASSRMKFIIPFVSAMSLLAASAQAQDSGPPRHDREGHPPAGPGAGAPPRTCARDPRRSRQPGPRASPAVGSLMPAALVPRTRVRARKVLVHKVQVRKVLAPAPLAVRRPGAITPGAPCRRATGADTPIAAILTGVEGAGATRSTTAVPAGGGMSAASGIIIRSGWKARRPISPRTITTTCRWPMPRDRHRRLRTAASAAAGRSRRERAGRCHRRRRARRPDLRQRLGRGRGCHRRRCDRRDRGAPAASRPGYYVAQGNCYYRYPSGQYVQADPRACY